MADQQRWFKLWYSALADDHLQDLPGGSRWAWVAFGAYTKVHGTNGRIEISPNNAVLAAYMDVPVHALRSVIETFPHVVIEEGKNRHGSFIVTWNNWTKYQRDSTQAERARASRAKRRGEENKNKRRPETLANANGTALSGRPDDALELLAFLNHKTGRNFQPGVNSDFIRARLKAGATVGQCRAVIGLKALAWKGTDMEKYLRPATLFNATKFAQYLGELPATAFSREGDHA